LPEKEAEEGKEPIVLHLVRGWRVVALFWVHRER
jgi:hypothetical protein